MTWMEDREVIELKFESDEDYAKFIEYYARRLDESGWMIVPQPCTPQGLWQMDSKFGPVPAWA
jgi:hypothetical protein